MVSASIVLYNPNVVEVKQLICNLLDCSLLSKIYLIDNSKNYLDGFDTINPIVEYIHNPSNPGFGSAHNIAINHSIKSNYEYHFVINPDIYIENDIFEPMVRYMSQDENIGMMMPRVLNHDGSLQYLPKLLPSPMSILLRKLKVSSFLKKYEMRTMRDDTIYNIPILSGSFTLLRLSAIKQTGMYDDNFFMYFEDWDLARRVHKQYKTLYFPLVSVKHGYDSGANKSFRLLKIYLKSMIYYFNKWGWLFDKERATFNKRALKQV